MSESKVSTETVRDMCETFVEQLEEVGAEAIITARGVIAVSAQGKGKIVGMLSFLCAQVARDFLEVEPINLLALIYSNIKRVDEIVKQKSVSDDDLADASKAMQNMLEGLEDKSE